MPPSGVIIHYTGVNRLVYLWNYPGIGWKVSAALQYNPVKMTGKVGKSSRMNDQNLSVGRWGEAVAEEYLQRQGYLTVARNVRTPYGELDLIMQKDDEVIIVEVKTRTSRHMGLPESSMTPGKTAHLIDAAEHYIQEHPLSQGTWRIDVVAVVGRPGCDRPQIEWFRDAVA